MSLLAAILAGKWVLCLLLFSTFCRLIYSFPIPNFLIPHWLIPKRFLAFGGSLTQTGIRTISDFPLAKTLAVSLGWATSLTMTLPLANPPVLKWDVEGLKITVIVYLCIFFNLLCRTLLTDFEDSLGDRLFGSRTSVTLLGPKKASRLMGALLGLWTIYLLILQFFIVPSAPIFLLIIPGPILNALALSRLNQDSIGMGGYKFDLALDGQFFLVYLLLLVWSLL
jgi:4-hydroxybenzoate polyprenyltransferase